MENENFTEFNGNISCLMRHHRHIESFMRARAASDYHDTYIELQNLVADIVPEMDPDEYEQWLEHKREMRNAFTNIHTSSNNVAISKAQKKIARYNFINKLGDLFEQYMQMSKKKGMLQRNMQTFEDIFQ
tara:strand:- start:836 stop:1225 length:390 start_codon:yes stop_codon:yes gene_type:complete